MKITKIALRDLYADPELNPRTSSSEEAISKVKEGILASGGKQPVPLGVRKGKNGKYQVIEHYSTFEALKRISEEYPQDEPSQFAFCVERKADDKTAYELSLRENVFRTDLNPLEEAKAVKRLIEGGMTYEEAGRFFQKSEAWAIERIAMLDFKQSVQKRIESGEVPPAAAQALARIRRALEQAGASKTEINEKVEEVLDAAIAAAESLESEAAEAEHAASVAAFAEVGPAEEADGEAGADRETPKRKKRKPEARKGNGKAKVKASDVEKIARERQLIKAPLKIRHVVEFFDDLRKAGSGAYPEVQYLAAGAAKWLAGDLQSVAMANRMALAMDRYAARIVNEMADYAKEADGFGREFAKKVLELHKSYEDFIGAGGQDEEGEETTKKRAKGRK